MKFPRFVGERVKLKADGVGGERAARQPRPFDRALSLFDPLLACAAMVVEGYHAFGRPRRISHDEANARAKLTRVPLDLRHHAARLLPALRLIAEARMEPPHVVRRTPDRTREQVADLVLQDAVARQAYRVLDAFGFKELVHLRHGEGRIAAKIKARDLALIARLPGVR
jgi:hypothetical protein